MTKDEISAWLSMAPEDAISDVKENAAMAYAKMPVDCRRLGASLVLLELEILIYEFNKNRKHESY